MAAVKQAKASVLTINGGSSSIKFALFEAGDSLRRILEGGIERIGLPEARALGLGTASEERNSGQATKAVHVVSLATTANESEIQRTKGLLLC